MLFNSIEFAIFLPIVFILYWLVFNRNLKLQNFFIVCVSYLFYGWWDWRFLILIAFTSLCSYLSGILIETYRARGKISLIVNIINIVVNLSILGVFKYYNFFVTSFADVFLGGNTSGLLLKIVLPVGISFYTFQALSYSIDVYKKKLEPTKDIIVFFAFVSFFPQLVAGPIERATNLLPQFSKQRVFDYSKAVDGMRQILWGLFKKVVVADNCATYVNQIYDTYQDQSGSTLLAAALLFSIQIYGDFSGYSDIAIGSARLFGIQLIRNFNFPCFSRDIAEFWRRWHISLTTWFRDYVYIPLGGSRVSKIKIIRNTFVIFLVSGFWHGANWTYIGWGAFHAILFLPLILFNLNRRNTGTVAEGKMFPSPKEILEMGYTFLLVAIGLVIFRSETIGNSFEYIGGIFNRSLFSIPYMKKELFTDSIYILILMVIEWINRTKQHGLEISDVKYPIFRFALYLSIALLIIFCGGKAETFIYFQF